MVRRGSTVRVRQRALTKRRKSALFVLRELARSPACGGDGALYGALRFTTRVRNGEMNPYGAFRFEDLAAHVPPSHSRPPERVLSRSTTWSAITAQRHTGSHGV